MKLWDCWFIGFIIILSCIGCVGPTGGTMSQLTAIQDSALASGSRQLHVVAVGDSGKISTAHGRPPFTWIERISGVTQRLNFVKFSPTAASLNVLAVGDAGTILRSTDAGNSWSPKASGTTSNLKSISYLSGNEAEIVGEGGVALKTTDGGNTWFPQTSGTTNNLTTVYPIGPSIMLAAGSGGIIRRTTDGGTTWYTVLSASPTITFNMITGAIRANVGLVLWAIGTNGVIYFSENYGTSWSSQSSTTTQNLNDVHFHDGYTGAAFGNGGTVRHTTNGGVTWLASSYYNSQTTQNIQCVFATVEFETSAARASRRIDTIVTSVVIAGNGVYATTTGQTTGVLGPLSSLPKTAELYQNYPNPFNPSTTIRFTIPGSAFVTLKVFDIRGKELATLVHEELNVGPHEAIWDAAGTASGVYFYRLQAGNSSETKKLILLR